MFPERLQLDSISGQVDSSPLGKYRRSGHEDKSKHANRYVGEPGHYKDLNCGLGKAMSIGILSIGKDNSKFSRMRFFQMARAGVFQVTGKLKHKFKIPHQIIGQIDGGYMDIQLWLAVHFNNVVQ